MRRDFHHDAVAILNVQFGENLLHANWIGCRRGAGFVLYERCTCSAVTERTDYAALVP